MLFSNAIYKLIRGNFPGQKSKGICHGRNFIEDSCLGVVVQGELFREKVLGQMPKGEFHGGNIFLGLGNCPGGNYQGVIVRGNKFGGSSPGGISEEEIVRGVVVQVELLKGNCPVVIVLGVIS